VFGSALPPKESRITPERQFTPGLVTTALYYPTVSGRLFVANYLLKLDQDSRFA